MFTPSGQSSLLDPLDEIVQASLHSGFPGAGGGSEIAGVSRAALAWGPELNGSRTTGPFSFTLPNGGSVSWIGMWAGNQFRAFVPWGGAENLYSVLASRVVWRLHGLANGDRVVFVNGAPVGLTEGVGYYVVGATQDDFQVAATAGGPPISILPQASAFALVSKFVPGNYPAGAVLTCGGITVAIEQQATVTAPIVVLPQQISVPQSGQYSFASAVTTPDSFPITEYSLAQGAFPAGVNTTNFATTGQVTLSASASGSATLRLRVKDSRGVETVSEPFLFVANAKPVWGTTTINTQVGTTLNLAAYCTDQEGAQIVFAAPIGLNSGMSLSGSQLTVPQTPGTYSAVISASDGVNPAVLATITLNVAALPVASGTFSAELVLNYKLNTVHPQAGTHWNLMHMDEKGGLISWSDGDHGIGPTKFGPFITDTNAVRYFNDTPAAVNGIAPGATGYLSPPKDRFRMNTDQYNIRGITSNRLVQGANATYPFRFLAAGVASTITGGKVRFIHGTGPVASDSDPSVLFIFQDGSAPSPIDSEGHRYETSGPPYSYPFPQILDLPNGLYIQFVPSGGSMSGSVNVKRTVSYPPYARAEEYDNYHWWYFKSEKRFYWLHGHEASTGGGMGGIWSHTLNDWEYGNTQVNPYIDEGVLQTNPWMNAVSTRMSPVRLNKNTPNGYSEEHDTAVALAQGYLWYLEPNPDHLTDGRMRRMRQWDTPYASYPFTMTINDGGTGYNSVTAASTNFHIVPPGAAYRGWRILAGTTTADIELRDAGPDGIGPVLEVIPAGRQAGAEKRIAMGLSSFTSKGVYVAMNGSAGQVAVYTDEDWTGGYMHSGRIYGNWFYFIRPTRTLGATDSRQANGSYLNAEFWRVNITNPNQFQRLADFPGFYAQRFNDSSGILLVPHPPTNSLVAIYTKLYQYDIETNQWIDRSPANWPTNGFIDGMGDIKKSRTEAGAYEIIFNADAPTGIRADGNMNSQYGTYFHKVILRGSKPQGRYVEATTDMVYPGVAANVLKPFFGKHHRFIYANRWRDADTGQLVYAGQDGGFIWQFGGDYKGAPYTDQDVPNYPVRLVTTDGAFTGSGYPFGSGSRIYRGYRISTAVTATTAPIEIRNGPTGQVIDVIPAGTPGGTRRILAWNAGITCSTGIYVSNPSAAGGVFVFTRGTWVTDSGRQDNWRAPIKEIGGKVVQEMSNNFAAFYPLVETLPENVELSPLHPDGVGIVQARNGDFIMGPGYFRFPILTEPPVNFDDGIMRVYRWRLPGKHTDGVRRGDAWDLPAQNYLIVNNAQRVNADDIVMGNAPGLVIAGASNIFTCYDPKEDVMMPIGQQSIHNFRIYKFQWCEEWDVFSINASTDRIGVANLTLVPGDIIRFVDGAPPSGLSINTPYQVINTRYTGVNDFQLTVPGGDGTPINITGSAYTSRSFTIDTAANRVLSTGHGFANGTPVRFILGRVPLGTKREVVYEAFNVQTNSFQIRLPGTTEAVVLRGPAGVGCVVRHACRIRKTYADRTPYRWSFSTVTRDQAAFFAAINSRRRNTGIRGFSEIDRTASRIKTGSTAFPHNLAHGDVIRFVYGPPPAPLLQDADYQVMNPQIISGQDTFQVGEIGSSTPITLTEVANSSTDDTAWGKTCTIRHKGKKYASVSAGTFTMTGHGWIAGDKVKFVEGTPPAPLVLGQEYEIASATANTFTVKEVGGVSAITTTDSGSAACRVSGPPAAYSATNPPNFFTGAQQVIGDYAYVTTQYSGGSGAYNDGGGWLLLKINLRNPSDHSYILPPTSLYWIRGFDAPPVNPPVDPDNGKPDGPQSLNEYRDMHALGHRLIIGPPQYDLQADEPVAWMFNTNTEEWSYTKTFPQMRADAVAANPANNTLWPTQMVIEKNRTAIDPENGELWVMVSPGGVLKVRVRD